jgi:hypothetical protein
MVELPKRKVGIVSCSGEELPEGTVTRLATRQVLDSLRTKDTVTICLPLFLAGGEGDRAFARFYPTIAVDGCELRCAARGTEMYSSKPAASVVVRDLVAENGLDQPKGRRQLNEAGKRAVDVTAERIAGLVDQMLDRQWDRQTGTFIEASDIPTDSTSGDQPGKEATCACGSGIPFRTVQIGRRPVTVVALPLIFEQFLRDGKAPSQSVAQEMLEVVKIYNPVIPAAEAGYLEMILREYTAFYTRESAS